MKFAIRITKDTIDFVTYLNDGVRPEIQKDTFLFIEMNGPREITTKVMTLEERNAEIHAKDINELF